MRIRMSLPISAVVLAALLSGASPATAASTPSVSAEPSSLSLGETTTITASGLGGLETVTFGLADPDSGAFVGDGVEPADAAPALPVAAGEATVQFTPTRSGDAVIAVGTGESVLAEVTVSVSSATAEPAPATSTPAPSPTSAAADADDSAQAEPDPEAEAGRFTFVLVPLLAAAVVVVGGIIVVTRGRRKRRGD